MEPRRPSTEIPTSPLNSKESARSTESDTSPTLEQGPDVTAQQLMALRESCPAEERADLERFIKRLRNNGKKNTERLYRLLAIIASVLAVALVLLIVIVLFQREESESVNPEHTVRPAQETTPLSQSEFEKKFDIRRLPAATDTRPVVDQAVKEPAVVMLYEYRIPWKNEFQKSRNRAAKIAELFNCGNVDSLKTYNKVGRDKDFAPGQMIWIPGDQCTYKPPIASVSRPNMTLTYTVETTSPFDLQATLRHYRCSTTEYSRYLRTILPNYKPGSTIPPGTVLYFPEKLCPGIHAQ